MKNLKISYNILMQKISNGVSFFSSFLTNMPNTTAGDKTPNNAQSSSAENGYQKPQVIVTTKGITLAPDAYFLFVKDMFDALTLNYKHAVSETDFITSYIHYLKHIRKIVLKLKTTCTNDAQETAYETLLDEIADVLYLIKESNSASKYSVLLPKNQLDEKLRKAGLAGEKIGEIRGFLNTYEKFNYKSFTEDTRLYLEQMKKTLAEISLFDYYAGYSLHQRDSAVLSARLDALIEEVNIKMKDTNILTNKAEFEEGRKFGQLEGYTNGVINIYTQFGLNREEIARPIFHALYERIYNATPPQVDGVDFSDTVADLAGKVGAILLDQLKDQVTTLGLDKKPLTLEEIPFNDADNTALVIREPDKKNTRGLFLTSIFNNMKSLVSPAGIITQKTPDNVSGGSKALLTTQPYGVTPVNTTNDFVIPKNLLEASPIKKADKSQTKISPVPEIVQQVPTFSPDESSKKLEIPAKIAKELSGKLSAATLPSLPLTDAGKSYPQNDTNLMNIQERIRQDFVSKEPFPGFTTHAEHRNRGAPLKPLKPTQTTYVENTQKALITKPFGNVKPSVTTIDFPSDIH